MKRFSSVGLAEKASIDHVAAITQNPEKKRRRRKKERKAELLTERRNHLSGISVELMESLKHSSRNGDIHGEFQDFKWMGTKVRLKEWILLKRTSVRQKLPSDYEARLLEFQHHAIVLCCSSYVIGAHQQQGSDCCRLGHSPVKDY